MPLMVVQGPGAWMMEDASFDLASAMNRDDF
jgi:hypothetical protein